MPTEVVGDNTGDDYSGTIDVRMSADAATTNYDNTYIEVAKWNPPSDQLDSVIAFTGLSSISASSTVSAATFALYRTEGNTPAQSLDMHRCLRNWVENQATWNNYSTGNAWTTAGGRSDGNDRSATVSATLSTGTANGYQTISSAGLAADVEDFIDGTYSNYGWQMERNDGEGNSLYARFTDSEGTDGQRPYLSVTYAAAGGGATGKSNSLMGCFGGPLSGVIA